MNPLCSDCGQTNDDVELQKIIKKAQAHAKEENIPVAIYKEAGEWKYLNAFDAYRDKLPVSQVFSNYH